MSSQILWYVARAAGIVAWSLAAGSVVWGLALSTHALGRKPRPAWLFDLHRFLGGMALIFTEVHVLAILLDTFVHFGLVEVLVPFTGSWHPVAGAWGIAARSPVFQLAVVGVCGVVAVLTAIRVARSLPRPQVARTVPARQWRPTMERAGS